MKARRPTISVSMTEDENDLFRAEAARTDEPLNVMMIRLAKLGLEHQTQAEAAAESGKVTLIKAVSRDEPVGLLTADPAATAAVPTSTGIVPVQAAATSVIASAPAPVPAPRTVIKPTPTDAPISFLNGGRSPGGRRHLLVRHLSDQTRPAGRRSACYQQRWR